MWRKLTRNRASVAGGIITLVIIFTAIFAPLIAPHDPLKQNLFRSLTPPNLEHPLGTDLLGRDLLSRIIYGARISLMICVAGVTLALLLGMFLGVISGYYEGKIDIAIIAFTDLQLSFPMILLAILIVAILGPGFETTIIAVAFPSMPIFTRLMRSSVLVVKRADYVEAAKALGASELSIILRHILPNGLAPIIIQTTLRAATILLTAAGLSFLGLGVRPPAPEWGALLSGGRAFLRTAPWIVIFPGITIMFAVLGFNLLGDGLRDVLDPRRAPLN
jgi:peptide/nickel transport system permease protein